MCFWCLTAPQVKISKCLSVSSQIPFVFVIICDTFKKSACGGLAGDLTQPFLTFEIDQPGDLSRGGDLSRTFDFSPRSVLYLILMCFWCLTAPQAKISKFLSVSSQITFVFAIICDTLNKSVCGGLPQAISPSGNSSWKNPGKKENTSLTPGGVL